MMFPVTSVVPGISGSGGCRERLRARVRGEEYGEVCGEVCALVGVERVSSMVRIDLTTLSWITARQSMRSSRKAVGVYSR